MQFNTNSLLQTSNATPANSLHYKNQLQELLQSQIKSTPPVGFRKILLVRCLLANIYTLLLLYSGVMIGMLLPLPMPVSFATGTACGFIFLRGLRVLPGIFLGSWLAFMSAQDWLIAGVSAVCYTSYIGMLYAACLYYRCPSLIFYRSKDLKIFFFIGLGCTGVYCAVSTLLLEPSWTSFFNQWLYNTFSHLNGILVIATAILTWDARGLEFTTWQPQRQYLCLTITILILACTTAGMVVYQPACYLVLLLLASNKLLDLARNTLLALISLVLIITAINFSHYFNITWLQQQTTLDLLALQVMILLLVLSNNLASFRT